MIDQIFERQKYLGRANPNKLMRILFLTEVNRVYLTKRDEILWKLKDRMTGREIINAIVSFFLDIFFLVRVSIFQSKEMEIEFKELVNETIPSLNE